MVVVIYAIALIFVSKVKLWEMVRKQSTSFFMSANYKDGKMKLNELYICDVAILCTQFHSIMTNEMDALIC